MDLIESTFEQSEENSPFYQKMCPACKDPKKDIVLILDQCKVALPNILLLEFGSGSEGFVVNLPDSLDLTKFAPKAEDQDFVYEYVGCIGRLKRKYVSHVRIKRETGTKNYLFDDVIIRQQQDKPNIVKLAVYKLSPLTSNKNLAKNIESSVQVNVNCQIPLPDFWYHYVDQLRVVQPLVSPFVCAHGYLKPGIAPKSNIIRKIPPQIYEYLLEKFGGCSIKIEKEDDKCEVCSHRVEMLQKLKQSEKEMAKFADKLSNKKFKFCIDLEWL